MGLRDRTEYDSILTEFVYLRDHSRNDAEFSHYERLIDNFDTLIYEAETREQIVLDSLWRGSEFDGDIMGRPADDYDYEDDESEE